MNRYGVRIKWNTIACFEIRIGNTSIVTDPCIGISPGTDATYETVEACDIITLSHVHYDHITDIPALAKKFDPLILMGELSATPMIEWADLNPVKVYPVLPNLDLQFEDVAIRPLFGRHVDQNRTNSQYLELRKSPKYASYDPKMMDMFVLGSTEYRNYLFTAENGTKILIWGNDLTYTQFKILEPLKPDIAIMQLSKQGPEELAEFASKLGVKVLIPHHMDFSKTKEVYVPLVERMKKRFEELTPGGVGVNPEHGVWMEF